MRNVGFEFDVTALLLSTKDWRFSIKVNGDHNRNKILGISNSLAKYNEEANTDVSSTPKVLYKEGESTTAIYAVRSAGINPATGEEVLDVYKRQGLIYDAGIVRRSHIVFLLPRTRVII